MKQFILVGILLLCLTSLSLGEETLLSGVIAHGGYGGPAVKFTTINGEFAVLAGGQGGWIINHTFMIGGGGYGLATSHHPETVPAGFPWAADQTRTDFGYGGVILSYIGSSDRMIHPTFDLLVGGGAINGHLDDGSWDNDQPDYYFSNSDRFFIIEPSVSAELNIVNFMRLDLGAGYRLVSGVSKWGFANSDVSGMSASAALKFGKF